MSFIFLASPYSHQSKRMLHTRYLEALDASAWLVAAKREIVLSPIVLCHEMARLHSLPTDAGYWKEMNTAFLRVSACIYVLCSDGWEDSIGVQEEIDWAIENNRGVWYMIPTLDGQYSIRE